MKKRRVAVVFGRDVASRTRVRQYIQTRCVVLEAGAFSEVESKLGTSFPSDVVLSQIDTTVPNWTAQLEMVLALRFRTEKPLLLIAVDADLRTEHLGPFIPAPKSFFLRMTRQRAM